MGITGGARYVHLKSDDKENCFMVAFKTIPEDSTGVAHILEHTVLTGSEKYPIRDPFFSMIKRSMNTFMNAFTSSDWTAYPFASQNVKDFDNLLKVYLDATFYPNLHQLDFEHHDHANYDKAEVQTAFKRALDQFSPDIVHFHKLIIKNFYICF